LPDLRRAGCAFITTAVESFDDAVLATLAKGHMHADFLEALRLTRTADLPLSPTFIPFTPWTTLESYVAFLRGLAELDLIDQVAPVQLAIRLLIPQGSLLLELPEVRNLISAFDAPGLCYPWKNPDDRVDALWHRVNEAVRFGEKCRASRAVIFREVMRIAGAGEWPEIPLADRATIPYLTEPWYC
jgi:hypothetical protein